jgi:isocitrate dehydrogenase kinase/phosphatase
MWYNIYARKNRAHQIYIKGERTMYKTREGKILNESTIISRKRYDEMEEAGYRWYSVELRESAQEAYDRLATSDLKVVRIYSKTTSVRGYHKLYAMVKTKDLEEE